MSDETTDFELHPLADQFTAPKWDQPGVCCCTAVLPPMSEWIDAGRDWSRISCPSCGRGFVDEGDYIAIYDDGQEQYTLDKAPPWINRYRHG